MIKRGNLKTATEIQVLQANQICIYDMAANLTLQTVFTLIKHDHLGGGETTSWLLKIMRIWHWRQTIWEQDLVAPQLMSLSISL